MAQESISLPKAMFTGLELDDGDVVSGRTRDNLVELRVVRRGGERGHAMTGERFVAKWRGQRRQTQCRWQEQGQGPPRPLN